MLDGVPPLHVANGHCTTQLIEAAGLPGRTSIWADALHDGPVTDAGDEQLIRIRAAFIADSLEVSAAEIEADLTRWRAIVDDDDRYDELVLWFEHDLFDQLNLIQLLSRVGRERPVRKPVSLVSIDRYPGHANFKGFGELAAADIAALYERRRRVTPPQYALAALAWDAFRSGDRARLDSFVHEDTSALPYLAAALRRYLDEGEAHPSRLTRSERRLLEQLQHGPLAIHRAFAGMHEGETAYYITDSSFWAMVTALAGRSPALIDVSTSGAATARPSLPEGTLSLHR
jgi:hypothetical protein